MIGWGLTTVPLRRGSQLSGRAHCWPPSPRATSQPGRPQGSEAGWGSGRTHSLGGPLTLPAAQVPIPPRAWQRVPQSILPCPQATGVSNEGEGAPPCTLCSALMSPGECSGMLQKPQQHTGPLEHTAGTQNRLWGARTPTTHSHSPPNPWVLFRVGCPRILKKDVLPTPGEAPQDPPQPLTLDPPLPSYTP